MDVEAMQRFFLECRRKLNQIVYRAEGDVELGDVENTAFEVAIAIQGKTGVPFDFDKAGDRDHLLARLWNKFVKYADKHLRYAVSLDEDPDEERPTQAALVARTVRAAATSDPLVLLEREEAEADAERDLHARYSELVAYVLLFRRFDQSRKQLAGYLRISRCTLRYRLRRAEHRAKVASLFDGLEKTDPGFVATIARPRTRHINRAPGGEQWEWVF